jgi:hypothetical protein
LGGICVDNDGNDNNMPIFGNANGKQCRLH